MSENAIRYCATVYTLKKMYEKLYFELLFKIAQETHKTLSASTPPQVIGKFPLLKSSRT